jgi:hypothetical protein
MFAKNRPISKDATSTDAFTNIVWKSTKKVAFAFKEDVAVLAYC